MRSFRRAVSLCAAMVLPACGVDEPAGGLEEVFDVREAELVSAVSRGCVFELTSVVRAGTLPPIHDIFLSRLASGTCAWPAASIGLGTSIISTPSLSLVANDLGVAAGFTVKNGYSGSSPRTVGIKHVDPELMTVVRNTGFAVYLGTGSVFLGYLAIGADGTTLTAGGTKAGIISPNETGSGSNFIATFPDFFTSTTPPGVVAY
ncbi:hypothetical protein SAMN05443572_103344 [Myxococcus fulvus]|uniref:Uncharacterized protein n=2 Tax=Myxococcus fulvus TaxID=33 RepID=A0A511TBG2_MYXFU|nr:hypothetical protein MFU01_55250 [Myxococcus fulvus]SET81519.1 hypothetical protein SAMN05443572_103344 [Myxococcus fulvus]